MVVQLMLHDLLFDAYVSPGGGRAVTYRLNPIGDGIFFGHIKAAGAIFALRQRKCRTGSGMHENLLTTGTFVMA
jgi:hypothetical protein